MFKTMAIRKDGALNRVLQELQRARKLHPAPMRSKHEGYAILLEEAEELWDAIKQDLPAEDRVKEAIQVGAMVLAYLTEVEGLDL